MTATQIVLMALQNGKKITQWDMEALHTIRLGGIIWALRQKGYKIKTERGYRGMAIYSMKKARRR